MKWKGLAIQRSSHGQFTVVFSFWRSFFTSLLKLQVIQITNNNGSHLKSCKKIVSGACGPLVIRFHFRLPYVNKYCTYISYIGLQRPHVFSRKKKPKYRKTAAWLISRKQNPPQNSWDTQNILSESLEIRDKASLCNFRIRWVSMNEHQSLLNVAAVIRSQCIQDAFMSVFRASDLFKPISMQMCECHLIIYLYI